MLLSYYTGETPRPSMGNRWDRAEKGAIVRQEKQADVKGGGEVAVQALHVPRMPSMNGVDDQQGELRETEVHGARVLGFMLGGEMRVSFLCSNFLHFLNASANYTRVSIRRLKLDGFCSFHLVKNSFTFAKILLGRFIIFRKPTRCIYHF